MNVTVDLPLVEEVVFLGLRDAAIHGDRAGSTELRRRLDSIYDLPVDSPERDRAFREFHLEAFERLGHDRLLRGSLREFRLLGRVVPRASFFKAVRQREEGGDLHVRDGSPTAVFRVRPVAFLEPGAFEPWLRRELLHIQDMVDPDFGYRPDLGEDPGDAARFNLIRDRFAVLWQLSIDGRLGLPSEASPVGRVFRPLEADERDALAESVRGWPRPTFDELLALARVDRPLQAIG